MDGQRPDIIITKTAITLACMNQSNQVSEKDILLAAEMALNHRTRDGGLLEPPTRDAIYEVFGKHLKLEIKKIKDLNDLKMDSIEESLDISKGNFLGEDMSSMASESQVDKKVESKSLDEKKK